MLFLLQLAPSSPLILKMQSTHIASWLRTSGATLWLVATRQFSTDSVRSSGCIYDSYA